MGPFPKHLIKGWALVSLCLATASAQAAARVQAQDTTPGGPPPAAALVQTTQEVGPSTAPPRIAELEGELKELTSEFEKSEGTGRDVLRIRIDRTLDDLVSASHDSARAFLRRSASGGAREGEMEQIIGILTRIPPYINAEIDRIREGSEFPHPQQTAAEQAALSARNRVQAARMDRLEGFLISNNTISGEMGLDTRSGEETLREQITRRAENTSDYLYVTTANLSQLRYQLAAIPKDGELKAKIAVTERQVRLAAEALRRLGEKMELLGLDASAFNAQLISATGALTTDILDWGVISGLFRSSVDSLRGWLSENLAGLLFRILVFLSILVLSWKAAGLAERVTLRALRSDRVNLSRLLRRTIVATARSLIMALGLLVALSQLGVTLGPLLAGLGIAGFIIGFALQDSLSNFASGVLILIYRPFDIGDLVEAGGAVGKVHDMSLVNTTILTFDNQNLIVPNNQVWQNTIKNVTAQTTRRVDLAFGISYGDDIDKAMEVLTGIIRDHARILNEPEPLIRLHELGESSVNFIVRPWVKTEDYWEVYWDITRQVKVRFDDAGISFPFPQRDVHLFRATVPPEPEGEAGNA